MLCSCEFTKWDNYEELVGEWDSNYPFLKGSKLTFYGDGTCIVENVPIKETDRTFLDDVYYYSLFWRGYGNEKTKEKVKSMDKWNFQGYWKVKEDTFYYKSEPYYRYRIQMSPHLEMLDVQQRDSFRNHTNADDAFRVEIDAWTISLFPPACLQYLSFYTCDPDIEYCFFSKKSKLSRMIQRFKKRNNKSN